jgi:cysteine desulfurase/selenocysteine lyase
MRRADFPALNRTVNGQPFAYLDTAASAQKPRVVIEKMAEVMETYYANIHRGLYDSSQKSTAAFEDARAKVQNFLGAKSADEIVFTRNATEAINLVAQSWGKTFLRPGDEIILTGMEHHANIVPWYMLAQERGIVIKVIPVLEDGTLDLAAFEKLLTHKTKVVAAVHISNALGTINNINKIIEISKDFYPKLQVLIDGSQAVVHKDVNIQALGCDFYVFTGHKIYGPSGIGVLWARAELLDEMPPYQGGGEMIETVSFDRITYKKAPAKFEAGTPAIVEAIALGTAIDYLRAADISVIEAREHELLAYAKGALGEIGGLNFYGPGGGFGPEKAGILSFTADWGDPSDIGTILDQCGVAVRTGHHCCQPLMRRFGIDATVRASFGIYTEEQDIDRLAAGLLKAKSMLG